MIFFPSLSAETLTNVLDFKREAGLWHGVLTVSIARKAKNCSNFLLSRVVYWYQNEAINSSVLSNGFCFNIYIFQNKLLLFQ